MKKGISESGALPRDLGDGLLLRRATAADAEALADLNAQVHHERGVEEPNPRVWAWTQDLMSGMHPTFRPSPNLTFLHLLFGHCTCGELRYVFRDCWTDNSEVRAVLDGLFPKRPSCVWPID